MAELATIARPYAEALFKASTGGTGVRVTSIEPGMAETEFYRERSFA